MRYRLGDVRRVIREEYLQGVPEWQLRQDTEEFVARLRDRITNFILVNKSATSADRQYAITAMNDVCDELEQKVYDQVEDQLFAFTRRV